MTPEQVTKMKARSYAMFGAGIAVFIVAYQYALPVTGRAEPPPEFAPYLFAAIGVVFFIIAGVMWLKARNQNVPAEVPVPLSGPQRKFVILWSVLGFAALAGSYFVAYLVPNDEILGLLLSVGLLVVMMICFVIASRIVRNMRGNAATPGVVKE